MKYKREDISDAQALGATEKLLKLASLNLETMGYDMTQPYDFEIARDGDDHLVVNLYGKQIVRVATSALLGLDS